MTRGTMVRRLTRALGEPVVDERPGYRNVYCWDGVTRERAEGLLGTGWPEPGWDYSVRWGVDDPVGTEWTARLTTRAEQNIRADLLVLW